MRMFCSSSTHTNCPRTSKHLSLCAVAGHWSHRHISRWLLLQELWPVSMLSRTSWTHHTKAAHDPSGSTHVSMQQPMNGGATAGAQTGALRLIRNIAQCGVRLCFANPGTTEMWLVAALDQSAGEVSSVLCLHETVCAGAADGYARMARKPAMALLHLGPGLANALANLHNARRARTPVLVIVGDMATWHVDADPLLAMDISGLACTVSRAVARPTSTADKGSNSDWATSAGQVLQTLTSSQCDLPPAPSSWQVTPGQTDSRVVTLVVPHDLSWQAEPSPAAGSVTSLASTPPQSTGLGSGLNSSAVALPQQVLAFVQQCAAALKRTPRGKAALYLGGEALLSEGSALRNAGLVAAACGATLLGENAFARVDRGAGLPHVTRLPYFPQEAARELARYEMLVTVDARLPVANFGYADGPSQLVPGALVAKDSVWELDGASGMPGGVAAVLAALAAELRAAQTVTPGVNCGGLFPAVRRPVVPAADVRLSPAVLCQCVAALQPEGCVLVDESLTSGGTYWDVSKACPLFSHLTLTGGAIGSGPPLALGAALACRDRCVINLQADGSAMYSLQALWSQAREQAHVITIICANNTYNILRVECARQRVPGMGPATRQLTDLGSPALDWLGLAQGLGVPGSRAATAGDLCLALQQAINREGPSLIQAVL